MTTTAHLDVLDRSVEKANVWINELAGELQTRDRHLVRRERPRSPPRARRLSRWITGTIQDQQLGPVAGAIERDVLTHRAADILRARRRLLDEIESRYLALE